MKVLLVDKDVEYVKSMKYKLSLHGHLATACSSVEETMLSLKADNFDFIVTNLHLEDIDPFLYLKLLKIVKQDSKVIVICDWDDQNEEVRALEFGVLYYLKKPLNIDALNIRLQNSYDKTNEVYDKEEVLVDEFHAIKVFQSKMQVFKNDVEVKLTRREYELLVFLMKNCGRVATRKEIEKFIYGGTIDHYESRIIDAYILKIRKKLGLDNIRSIRSVGYEWLKYK